MPNLLFIILKINANIQLHFIISKHNTLGFFDRLVSMWTNTPTVCKKTTSNVAYSKRIVHYTYRAIMWTRCLQAINDRTILWFVTALYDKTGNKASEGTDRRNVSLHFASSPKVSSLYLIFADRIHIPRPAQQFVSENRWRLHNGDTNRTSSS